VHKGDIIYTDTTDINPTQQTSNNNANQSLKPISKAEIKLNSIPVVSNVGDSNTRNTNANQESEIYNNADNFNKKVEELSNEAKDLHKKYSMYSDKVGVKDKSLWKIWNKSSKAVTWEQFLTANSHLADPNIIKPGDNIYMCHLSI
jgi:hypothetical protein